MKVIFMGTPEFSVPILKSLISAHEVLGVVTQPDKQQGRGKKFVPPPVKVAAIENNIPVFQPEKIRNTDFLDDVEADVFVVAAYGQILSEKILNIPKLGCINVHASILPKYRGAAPIQWAIINGEKQTGVTIMHMDKGVDTGDMILKKYTGIAPGETAGSLSTKLSLMGAQAIIEALGQIENGAAAREKQDGNLSSYAKIITKEMALIDFKKPGKEVVNLVNGLIPWPVAYTFHNGAVLKIWGAELIEGYGDGVPGEVLDIVKNKGFVVKAGVAAVLITEVQALSSKRMGAPDYLRGHMIGVGTVL
ncbi:MAG: methionyl-tRNA formyltransferase [Clostridiales bacterium]|jgi:methionyl-tRNA formyltransferase|nr:methionyl-tRNA formyltransferase [Clostridiales bacterium]